MKPPDALVWSDVSTAESTLIERGKVGDEAAYAEIVSLHERMVFSLGLHILGNREEAMDLSQKVFLRVFRKLGSFRGQSALKTWIYRIVVNQAKNRQRWWRSRHRSEQLSLEEHLQYVGDLASTSEPWPDRLLVNKENAARLWRALDTLPFDQRTALILREIDGLRYDEMAFSLGIAIGTVKSRLTRARQALRAELLGVRS